MVSADICEHNWPGSGCKDCRAEREAHRTESVYQRKCPFSAINSGGDVSIGAKMRTPIDLLDANGRITEVGIGNIDRWLEEAYTAGVRDAKKDLRERLGLT